MEDFQEEREKNSFKEGRGKGSGFMALCLESVRSKTGKAVGSCIDWKITAVRQKHGGTAFQCGLTIGPITC